MSSSKPILLVCHDEDDGAWQFLDDTELDADQAMLVSLHEVFNVDSTIADLANLPLGGKAWRSTPNDPWHKD
ncbi:DUF2185 domain-containing protein [Ruficoccus sp. ZRK36]|uniref:DUF2185 domain-containing protein n=1 Tax=Ruficoccus sp. ZRK36 TaxID=2866311 RepID=UPI001C72C8B7|nr:DUF2185 domain-containing protein [Ruficoccus sp. ZRK36]QYY36285.1 DUF2185 domain-containing protein [Ruficoccus sp. ZRK36]